MASNSSLSLPYRYAAYGAVFNSAIPLPNLPIAGSELPQRAIRLFWEGSETHTNATAVGTAGFSEAPGAVSWTLPGVVELVFEQVSTQSIDCLARGRAEHIAHFFLRSGLPRVLSMLGVGYLHASAVSRSGRAIAIVGASASGKSTAAAALVEAGCELLSDHGAAFVVDPQAALKIEPGTHDYQLYPDALPFSPSQLEPTDALPGGARYRVSVSRRAAAAATLSAVVVPTFASQALSSSLRLMRGTERLQAFLSAGGGASGSAESVALLRWAPQVAVYALERPPLPRQNLHQNLRVLLADWLTQIQGTAGTAVSKVGVSG